MRSITEPASILPCGRVFDQGDIAGWVLLAHSGRPVQGRGKPPLYQGSELLWPWPDSRDGPIWPSLLQRLSSLVDRDVLVGIVRPQIFGARTDQAIVVELLDDMGGPATDAGDRKDGREQVDIDSQGVIS